MKNINISIIANKINNILDSIDEGINYIGVELLKLPIINIWSIKIRPNQIVTFMFTCILTGFFIMGQARAGEWHDHGGWAEAESLGSNWSQLLNEQFTNPKIVNIDSVSNQSYAGIIMSDEYGSIFSSREGIVTKLHVNLWDTVKKWQTVATISTMSNSPEIIALLAEKRADIAISQWQLNAARNVSDYLQSQLWWSGNATENVYTQKQTAIDISIDTQRQQLQTKINSLKAQINAKKQFVEANKISSQSTIWLNEEKQRTAEKELQGSIQYAITTMGRIFAKSEINYQWFEKEFNRNIYRWARSMTQRSVFIELMSQVLKQYSNRNNMWTQDKFELAQLTEKAVKWWIDLIWLSTAHSEYSAEQMSSDLDSLIKTYSDKDIWLATILSKYKELQKELIWSNAIASGGIIQANAELAWLDQEILLLGKEIELLEAEKKKSIAELNSDHSLRVFDLQKMIIESQAEIVKSEAVLQANQNAIWAIQSTVKSTLVTAPFAWTISRKNIVVWQSVETSTPIFDIVWLNSISDSFVRFEVPVAEFKKIKIWNPLVISLPWSEDIIAANISRVAQSVNQNNQTITVEGSLQSDWTTLPLGTNVRVSGQWFSGENVVWVPNSAVLAQEDGSVIVYKVLPNQTLKKRKVTVVSQDSEMSYIQWWLKAEDTITLHADDEQRSEGKKVESEKVTLTKEKTTSAEDEHDEHTESDGHTDH